MSHKHALPEPENVAEQQTVGGRRPSPCSRSLRITAIKHGGAQRMLDEIKRLAIMRERHTACPKCGGQVQASDGSPVIKPKYCYAVECEHCGEIVYGHSVESVCRQWVARYPENAATHAPGANETNSK